MGTRIPSLISRRNLGEIMWLQAKKHKDIIINNGMKALAIGGVSWKVSSGNKRAHDVEGPSARLKAWGRDLVVLEDI